MCTLPERRTVLRNSREMLVLSLGRGPSPFLCSLCFNSVVIIQRSQQSKPRYGVHLANPCEKHLHNLYPCSLMPDPHPSAMWTHAPDPHVGIQKRLQHLPHPNEVFCLSRGIWCRNLPAPCSDWCLLFIFNSVLNKNIQVVTVMLKNKSFFPRFLKEVAGCVSSCECYGWIECCCGSRINYKMSTNMKASNCVFSLLRFSWKAVLWASHLQVLNPEICPKPSQTICPFNLLLVIAFIVSFFFLVWHFSKAESAIRVYLARCLSL